MSPISVSVIIPAYNASATIGQTLEALSRQIYPDPIEVIVVDDGSLDTTKDVVTSFPTVRYVRQNNAGPASARNCGASLAQGEYLVFTDSDCIPHEDWISELMKGFVRQEVGVVAGSYGIANRASILARCVYKEILWRHVHLMPDYPNAFGSYNFCVKKSVFEAVGGFNTAYRHASGEDNDLSYKIRKSWRIFFNRKALVDHYHPTQIFRYLKEQFRHGFWRVKMYNDHPTMMAGDGYTFWKDMIELPLGVWWLVASCFCFTVLNKIFLLAWGLFLLFEMIWAFVMTSALFEGIFFGSVMFVRAFARLFGFSTGFLAYFVKKMLKIFE
ncbi:MAG: glycosyltransferase [Candidatus Omnitrophica bacterium]|nr:glycosyltransferase [Candidatus Omnitrophota bacterium]